MQFKTILGTGVMTVAVVAIAHPATAQPIPAIAVNACTQRVAEAMVVATRDIELVRGGPVDALKGTQTLFMRNRVTGQTAECYVNTIDGTVLSVRIASQQPRPPQTVPQASINACIQRTAEAMVVAARDIEFVSAGPISAESGATTLVLRNRVTGQRAECRVNTVSNTVLSVTVTPVAQPPSQPQAVPQSLINACIQRTAEAMVVAARDIEFVQADPPNPNGTRTLFMRNRVTRKTANCLVNPATNTVISVTVTPAPQPVPPSQGRPVSPKDPSARSCQATVSNQVRRSFANVQRVNFLSNTTRAFSVSNTKERIQGEGEFFQKSNSPNRFSYDCVVNIRNGQVQSATHTLLR